nr:hypothetical protein FVER53263_20352 [Fusarium verticillioides]
MASALPKLSILNLIAATLPFIPPTTALRRSNAQFRQFFPAWHPLLQGQLKHNCSSEIQDYLNISSPALRPGYRVIIDCILTTMPEFGKTELASAAVILGRFSTSNPPRWTHRRTIKNHHRRKKHMGTLRKAVV